MFGVGFVLFSIYLVFLIWNIKYNGEKQKEENYPNLDLNTQETSDSKESSDIWFFPVVSITQTIENKKTSRNTKFREVLKHSENVVVIAPGLLKSFLIICKSVFFSCYPLFWWIMSEIFNHLSLITVETKCKKILWFGFVFVIFTKSLRKIFCYILIVCKKSKSYCIQNNFEFY